MVHLMTVLIANLKDLILFPRTLMVERENKLLQDRNLETLKEPRTWEELEGIDPAEESTMMILIKGYSLEKTLRNYIQR